MYSWVQIRKTVRPTWNTPPFFSTNLRFFLPFLSISYSSQLLSGILHYYLLRYQVRFFADAPMEKYDYYEYSASGSLLDKMRLLDTLTGLFVNSDSPEFKEPPRYAILSHRWSSNGEQTYRELRKIQKRYYPRDGPAKTAQPSSHSQEPPLADHAENQNKVVNACADDV